MLSLHPGTLHVALAVENNEVGICTSTERALLVLNSKTFRWIVCRAFDRLTERAAREAGEVPNTLVQRDDTVGLVSEIKVP